MTSKFCSSSKTVILMKGSPKEPTESTLVNTPPATGPMWGLKAQMSPRSSPCLLTTRPPWNMPQWAAQHSCLARPIGVSERHALSGKPLSLLKVRLCHTAAQIYTRAQGIRGSSQQSTRLSPTPAQHSIILLFLQPFYFYFFLQLF